MQVTHRDCRNVERTTEEKEREREREKEEKILDFATQPEPTREGRRQIIYLMALRFRWMELNDDTLANLYDIRGAREWLANVYFRSTCYGSFGTYLGNKRWLMRPISVDK